MCDDDAVDMMGGYIRPISLRPAARLNFGDGVIGCQIQNKGVSLKLIHGHWRVIGSSQDAFIARSETPLGPLAIIAADLPHRRLLLNLLDRRSRSPILRDVVDNRPRRQDLAATRLKVMWRLRKSHERLHELRPSSESSSPIPYGAYVGYAPNAPIVAAVCCGGMPYIPMPGYAAIIPGCIG